VKPTLTSFLVRNEFPAAPDAVVLSVGFRFSTSDISALTLSFFAIPLGSIRHPVATLRIE
jgi:hypothetical protein